MDITVEAADGSASTTAEYISKGKERFEDFALYDTSTSEFYDMEKNPYPLGTDESGTNAFYMMYGIYLQTVNTVTKTAELTTWDDFFEAIERSDYFEALNMSKYSWQDDAIAYIYLYGNPVLIDDAVYEWLRVEMMDREFYMAMKINLDKEEYYYYDDEPDDYYQVDDSDAEGFDFDGSVEMYESSYEVLYIGTDINADDGSHFAGNFGYYGACMAAYDGKIYSVGGLDTDDEDATEGSREVYVFDPGTAVWSKAQSAMPSGFYNGVLQVSNGAMYAMLGSRAGLDYASFDVDRSVYRFDGNNWSTMPTKIPEFVQPVFYNTYSGLLSNVATAINSDGIIVTGTSTDGYGDTYLIDTTNPSDISICTTKYTLYEGLSTQEEKTALLRFSSYGSH